MKNLIKVILSFVVIVLAIQIHAFEAFEASNTFEASSTKVHENLGFNSSDHIKLDNDKDTFIAPDDGTYIVSYTANAFNPLNRTASITVSLWIEKKSQLVPILHSLKTQIPSHQAQEIKNTETLNLEENDEVTFHFKTSEPGIKLQPTATAPSFRATINPEKLSVKL